MTEEQIQQHMRIMERALELEREAHIKTANELMAERDMRRQADDLCEALRAQLRKLAWRVRMLEPATAKPDGIYSCAVCSSKTEEPPIRSVQHTCCGSAAFVGPCCKSALEQSPETVSAILHDCGHAARCKQHK